MKVAIFTDILWAGGAQTQARNLISGLSKAGVDATLFFEHYGKVHIPENTKSIAPFTNFISAKGLTRNSVQAWIDEVLNGGYEILHCHNIHCSSISIETIFEIEKFIPVVWTLHDMSPFTGGCNLPVGCPEFKHGCKQCPSDRQVRHFRPRQEGSPENRVKFLNKLWKKDKRPHLVLPSKWLLNEILSSPVLSGKPVCHTIIPNCIDDDLYQSGNSRQIRKQLDIPENLPVVLLVANDLAAPLKGSDSAVEILNEAAKKQEFSVLWLGNDSSQYSLKVKCAGKSVALPYSTDLSDIVQAYQAADILFCPSYYENFPMTILEGMACGLTVVTRNIGGTSEQVVENQNGWLFKSSEEAVDKLCTSMNDLKRTGLNAKKHVKNNFSINKISDIHKQLYQTLKRPPVRAQFKLPSVQEKNDHLTKEQQWHIAFVNQRFYLWHSLGYKKIALFGAGKHTEWLLKILNDVNKEMIVCIVDDNADSNSVSGVPVVCSNNLKGQLMFQAVIPSSDAIQDKLASRCKEIFKTEIPILLIYDNAPEGPYDK